MSVPRMMAAIICGAFIMLMASSAFAANISDDFLSEGNYASGTIVSVDSQKKTAERTDLSNAGANSRTNLYFGFMVVLAGAGLVLIARKRRRLL